MIVYMDLTKLNQCHPIVRVKTTELISLAGMRLNMSLMIVRGWTSWRGQMLIYQDGRTFNRGTGVWEVTDAANIKTRAMPGKSGHNIVTKTTGAPASLCVDLIPLDHQGQPLWALPTETPVHLAQRWIDTYEATEETMWSRLYTLAWKCGLDPYGDAIGATLLWDKGHFEEPAYHLVMNELGVVQPSADVVEVT